MLVAVRDTANVVHQQNVDIDDAQALLAVFERAQNAVMRVVVDRFERQRILPAFLSSKGVVRGTKRRPTLVDST